MTSRNQSPDLHWSRRLPLGLVLLLSAMFLGFFLGAWFASTFLVTSQGMVAGAEVVVSGFFAAILAAILSAIAAFRLSLRSLTIASVVSAVLALLAFVLFSIRMDQIQEARKDPESEYANVAAFSASVEQLVVSDPYLRIKIEVDSRTREWTSTGPAPDNQICKGTARAAKLLAVSDALKALVAMDQSELTQPFQTSGPAERRLSWTFDPADGLEAAPSLSGTIDFSDAQLRAAPEVARAVAAMGLISASPTSPVKCD